jgi:threonine/homoserine/homoserine lactone efflux protein
LPVTVQFLLGVLGLLLVPGPTNTLLATSGALAGVRRSLRLLPCELIGYLIAIGVWYRILRPLIALHPSGPLFSKLLACAYLIYTVTKLYNSNPGPSPTACAAGSPVSPGEIFFVTLLNPKAVVFALLVFDQSKLNISEFAVFSVTAPCVALIWISLGRTLVAAGVIKNPLAISRIAAAILVLFVGLLINSILGAL